MENRVFRVIDAAVQAQQRQPPLDRRDLIGLRVRGDLAKHDPVGHRPGAD